ncbi:MAG: hypothetical protein WCC17_05030 [Candidatus Nitrosopolaris sp.]
MLNDKQIGVVLGLVAVLMISASTFGRVVYAQQNVGIPHNENMAHYSEEYKIKEHQEKLLQVLREPFEIIHDETDSEDDSLNV